MADKDTSLADVKARAAAVDRELGGVEGKNDSPPPDTGWENADGGVGGSIPVGDGADAG